MIITRTCLSRRAVLRGAGATIALPLLDAMIPALSGPRLRAASRMRRFGAIYLGMGTDMHAWVQPGDTTLPFDGVLAPLERFKDRVVVLSGLDNTAGAAADGGVHPRKQTAWLTGSSPRATEGVDIRAGVSLDQLVAQEIGTTTQLPSMELALESTDLLGSCSVGYSCAYNNTIAWKTPTLPLPMENNPRRVFEMLFGASRSTDARSREAEIQVDRSVLDSVRASAAGLRKQLSRGDATKLAEYLDAVRDVERRVQKSEGEIGRELPVMERPPGIPPTFEAHAKMMFELQTLAFQTDLTRVFTFLVVRESSQRSYPEIGVPDAHHSLSHHQNDPVKLAKLAKITSFEMSLVAYFVERLQTTVDGDGTLLDNTMLLIGSGMSDPNAHIHINVPTMVVTGKNIPIAGNRHLKYPDGTPLANLQMAMVDKVGVDLEKFGEIGRRVDLLPGL